MIYRQTNEGSFLQEIVGKKLLEVSGNAEVSQKLDFDSNRQELGQKLWVSFSFSSRIDWNSHTNTPADALLF